MFSPMRPRPAPAWTVTGSLRPAPRLYRGALIERVQGGIGLVQSEQLLLEFGRQLELLFEHVPGLPAAVLGSSGWSCAPGQLAGEYRLPMGVLLLARRGPTAAGMVGVRPLPERPGAAELQHLFVRLGHRGEGVARELLGRAVGEATRLGYRELFLETSPLLADAVRLYHLAGFEHVPTYRPHPGPLVPHLAAMARSLA